MQGLWINGEYIQTNLLTILIFLWTWIDVVHERDYEQYGLPSFEMSLISLPESLNYYPKCKDFDSLVNTSKQTSQQFWYFYELELMWYMKETINNMVYQTLKCC